MSREEEEKFKEDLEEAYTKGWLDGYKAKHVEFDWISEGFEKFYTDRYVKVWWKEKKE